ncbi:hypothetical protein [Mucilaginibacter sp.]|uniref:hypothetical protein n=1 Tax=Mucilaginibacter sp. TaxID=1882438 RepID=UPI0035BC48D7
MTLSENVSKTLQPALLIKTMLIGAGIALAVITVFILPVNPNPGWGKFWMIRPLIITPLAGAAGGAVYYVLNWIANPTGWIKVGVITLSLVVYLISLWLGIILGLVGTLWN